MVPTSLEKSSINGFGIFAPENIPARKLVWEFSPEFDVEFEPDQLALFPLPAREFILHYGNLTEPSGRSKLKGVYLLCGDNARFMNHSNHPNISAGTDQNCALRDIIAGEELTCDYREFDLAFKIFEG